MNEIQLAHLMDEIPSLYKTLLDIKDHMLACRIREQVLDERVLRRKLTQMLATMDACEKKGGSMMAKDNTVSLAEFARVERNRETFALLRTFAMAVLSSFDEPQNNTYGTGGKRDV